MGGITNGTACAPGFSTSYPNGQPMLSELHRALLVDDDPCFLNVLRDALEQRHKGISVESRSRLSAVEGYGIYFIPLGLRSMSVVIGQIEEIRYHQCDAFIVAVIEQTDEQTDKQTDEGTLKELANAGCNFICDKRSTDDLGLLGDRVEQHLQGQHPSHSGRQNRPKGVLAGLVKLVSEMNSRLDRLDRLNRVHRIERRETGRRSA